jgi:alpha-amylase
MINFDLLDLSIFKNLSKEDLALLRPVIKQISISEGDVIFYQGELNKKICIILEGKVGVIRTSNDGEAGELVAVLEAGQTAGEISVLTGKSKTATLTALTNVTALILNFDDLVELPNSQDLKSKITTNLVWELSRKLEQNSFKEPPLYIPCTVLTLFGWRWKDILYEIPFLTEHGYDAIKISPPQEFVVRNGSPWWTMYQPVSYFLSSYYGNLDEFKSMISLAHSYGIKVYADFVTAHMADAALNEIIHTGNNGHTFKRCQYNPLNQDGDAFNEDDFFQAPPEQYAVTDQDYKRLERVWNLETKSLLNMPKLDFSKEHVIMVLRKYAKFLLSLGIDGFRIDASKHIDIDGLKKIIEGLTTKKGAKPFIYQEYFLGQPEGVDVQSYMNKYFQLGHVTCFSYGIFLSDVILMRGSNTLQSLVEYSFGTAWVNYPDNKAIVVLDNHDTERYVPTTLNYKYSYHNAYIIGYIFMLAWPFGIPKVMSSVEFFGVDDPLPMIDVIAYEKKNDYDPHNPWICQHRWRQIANMVLFRSKTKMGKGITNIWLNGNQIAFSRAVQKPGEAVFALGFVLINNTAEVLKRRFETGLPKGFYSDFIHCILEHTNMIGPTIQVEDYGFANITVAPYDAVVLCLGYCSDTNPGE